MPRIESSTQISASPERVWALLCDPTRYPEWVVPTDRMLEVPPGEMGVDYLYREYGGVAPFKSASTWLVTEFEPPRRQVHIGDDGKMAIELTVDLTPANGGTRVAQAVDLQPRWWLAPLNLLLWPLLMRQRSQRAMDETLENCKRLLEREAA